MENSHISWCDHTLNYWMGCSHSVVPVPVSITGEAHESPECLACYAENMMDNRFSKVIWGKDGTRKLVRSAIGNARKWNKESKLLGIRPRVFCQSLSDTFEKFEGIDEWRMDLLHLISECTDIEWLLLSKHLFDRMANDEDWRELVPVTWREKFPSHVRIGCTGGTQETYDYRVRFMQEIPAKNFVSVEPMLQRIDFGLDKYKVDHLILGGQSRQGALYTERFDFEWAIDGLEQIKSGHSLRQTAFFFKQAGSNPYYLGRPVRLSGVGEDLSSPLIPEILKVREFPQNNY